jgi:hypothetical protein
MWGEVSMRDTRPHINNSSGCSGTPLYYRHKYYTDTEHCVELIVFPQLPIVQLFVLLLTDSGVGVGVLLAADSQSTTKTGYRASLWDP